MADTSPGNANRIFLFAAILLGVLAMVMAFAFIQNAAKVEPETMDIVLAAKDLLPNTVINPETDLFVAKWPVPSKQVDATMFRLRALDPKSLNTYRGARVNRFIPSHTQILNTDIGSQEGDVQLKAGCVAMSISVRGANGLAGLLIPGDYVKLLVTRPRTTAAAEGEGKWETVPALPKETPAIKVVAVGNKVYMARSVTAAQQYNSNTSPDALQVITLELTEQQAAAIQSMSGNGVNAITLLLAGAPAENAPAPRGRSGG